MGRIVRIRCEHCSLVMLGRCRHRWFKADWDRIGRGGIDGRTMHPCLNEEEEQVWVSSLPSQLVLWYSHSECRAPCRDRFERFPNRPKRQWMRGSSWRMRCLNSTFWTLSEGAHNTCCDCDRSTPPRLAPCVAWRLVRGGPGNVELPIVRTTYTPRTQGAPGRGDEKRMWGGKGGGPCL